MSIFGRAQEGASAPVRPDGRARGFRVRPDAGTEVVGERASTIGAAVFTAVLFAVVLAAGLGIGFAVQGKVTLAAIVISVIAEIGRASCRERVWTWV